MMRERNSQYSKFWKAESVLNGMTRQFKTDKSVATFVRKARERVFLTRRYGNLLRAPIRVSHLPGKLTATRWTINISPTCRTDQAIIRCLARLLFERMDDEVMAFHGWQFAAIYLDLVQALKGKAAADVLRLSFKAHNVRFKPKKKVVLTPEMSERLARARAKRNVS